MDLDNLSRQQLQKLAKDHNIKANLKTPALINLLQSQLASTSAAPEMRVTRSSKPLSVPPAAPATDDGPPSERTRKGSTRFTRAASHASRSADPSASSSASAPVEAEKENKNEPPRRKAREMQKRLGVGKPRIAGGAGARNVTRVVSNRPASARTRSRANDGEAIPKMTVVVEEKEESTPPTNPPPPQVTDVNNRITAIDSQISKLFVTRDTLLSKLSAQEKDIISIKDDLVTERGRILDHVNKSIDTRFARLANPSAPLLAETRSLLEAERQRVAILESQLSNVLSRLDQLEGRLAPSNAPSAPLPDTIPSATALGKRRAMDDENPLSLDHARNPKRARADMVTPPPRTPPRSTRSVARHQLESPRGPTSSTVREFPPAPPSPTTDSPRKGKKMKDYGDILPVAAPPSPVRSKRQTASATHTPIQPPQTPRPAPASPNFIDYLNPRPHPGETSPAFPVYQPPSARLHPTRRGSLGLGVVGAPSPPAALTGGGMLLPPYVGYASPRPKSKGKGVNPKERNGSSSSGSGLSPTTPSPQQVDLQSFSYSAGSNSWMLNDDLASLDVSKRTSFGMGDGLDRFDTIGMITHLSHDVDLAGYEDPILDEPSVDEEPSDVGAEW